MSDNTTLNTGTGGDTIRDKDRAGVKTQVAGLDMNVGGSSEVLMTAAALADATADPTTASFGSLCLGFNGTTWDRLRVDGSKNLNVNVQVSALPSGAATAAKQPALGAAGSASADVLSVQGIASMTPLKVDGSGTTQPVSGTVTANAGTNLNTSLLALESGGNLAAVAANTAALDLAQASTTSSQTGPLVQGATTTGAPTYVNTKTNPLSLDTSGNLRTLAAQAGTWNIVNISGTVSLPTGAAQESGNLATIATNTGALDLAQGSATSGQTGPLAQGAVTTGAPSYTTGKTDPLSLDTSGNLRTLAAQGGTWNVGTVTTVTTVTTVSAVTAISNALPAGTNTLGGVVPTAGTTGGCSGYSVNSSGATNQDAANIKGSAGVLYGWSIQNTTNSARYAKLYDKATAPTSADTPVKRLYLPPTGGNNMPVGAVGLALVHGLGIRLTTGAADNDTGACSANDVLANIDYE